MTHGSNHVVFGPRGVRILRLAASLNGQYLAFVHVPQNYNSSDCHWLFFRQSGDTYEQVGEIPGSPTDVAPLDDGQCLVLFTDYTGPVLTRWAAAAAGMTEVARWNLLGTLSLSDATLRLLPSGHEALVIAIDRDDKQVDWGGGPPPDYIQTWLLVDVATGDVRQRMETVKLDAPEISRDAYGGSRGVSVLVALGAPAWMGTRTKLDCAALQKIILPMACKAEDSAIRAGSTRLLTNKRVIDISSGETVLPIAADPRADRFEAPPRFHDLSPDENYALSTVADGHFALWNISNQSAWQPDLPAHGGVHNAIFLPGRRAALGTKLGGVIVVDCAEGCAAVDAAW